MNLNTLQENSALSTLINKHAQNIVSDAEKKELYLLLKSFESARAALEFKVEQLQEENLKLKNENSALRAAKKKTPATSTTKEVPVKRPFSKIIQNEEVHREDLVYNKPDLNRLFENLDETLFTFDAEKNIFTNISSACERIFGYTPEDFYNDCSLWKQMIHHEDFEKSEELLAYLNNGEKLHICYRIIHRNGSVRWIENTIIPTLGKSGRLIRVEGLSRDVTEKIKTESKIRQSEANSLALLENTGASTWSLDREGRLVIFNREFAGSFYQFTGRLPQKEDNFLRFLKEYGEHEWLLLFQRALTGEKINQDTKKNNNSGETVYLKISIQPIYINNQITGVSCSSIDTTESVIAERMIKQSEANLYAIINNTNDAIFSVDRTYRLITLNNAYRRFIAEHTGKEARQGDPFFYHQKDPIINKVWKQYLDRALTGEAFKVDSYNVIKNETVFFQISFNPIKEKDRIIGVGCFVRDITDEKHSAERLMSSETKYRHLFENNPSPMWVLDKTSNRFLSVNEAAIKHYGYTKEDFLNMTALDVVAPHLRDSFQELNETGMLPDKESQQWEHLKKDGSTITVEVNLNHIDFEGRPALLIIAQDITEKVKAEKKLKSINERYELVTKATNDAIWDWNLQSNKIFWSEGYDKLFGYTSSENKTISWTERIHPDDIQKVTKGIADAIKNKKKDFWEEEYRYLRADGTFAQIYDRGFVVYDEEKNPIRMVGAMQDISTRKMAEERLYKSEANLRNILESSDTAYVLLDENSVILSYNRLALELSKKEIHNEIAEGKNYLELMPLAQRPAIQERINHVLATGKPVAYEAGYMENSGSITWLYMRMHPIFNNTGKINGLSIGATDITERKTAAQRLEKSEANLSTIFNNTDVSYILLDSNLRIISFNTRAQQGIANKFGTRIREGMPLSQCIPDEQRQLPEEDVLKLKSGKKLQYERNFKHADGSESWSSLSLLPVIDRDKKMLGVIIAVEEITNRKNTELEKDNITKELIQRNKDLEQFAYIISHNLRAPVANITGLSNILLSSQDLKSADFKTCLKGLAMSVSKLDEVIIDLNYILQVRKEINEKKEEVSFAGLISGIKTSIKTLIEKENAEIVYDFKPCDSLFTLKSYLNSIFYNLILNSIKYRHPSRRPLINITSRIKGQKLILIFKDNGLGIDLKVNQNKVFGLYKKFHQHSDGKGMGLYMVKTQVEILGGKIHLNSEVGLGTEFIIELDMP